SEFFDVHATEQAKTQPKMFASAIGKIVTLLKGLVEAPFDNRRSMLDVTTVMVASEFGRTMRSDGTVDDTGTNHNQFSNSILLGGKGIRSGLVIGALTCATRSRSRRLRTCSSIPCRKRRWGCPSTSQR